MELDEMTLDDMKQAWQALDHRLERQNAISALLYRESRLDRVRNRLRPLWVGQIVQLIAGIAVILGAVAFWSVHRHSTHLLVCGLLLHAYGLMFILSAARNFFLMSRIDYGMPLVEIQKRVAALRAWRVDIEAPVFAVVGCFMWIPLVLVLFEAQLGADIWLHAPSVVWIFIGCGVIGLLVYFALRYWMRRRSGHAAEAFDRETAGKSVFRAQAELDEIVSFERE